MGPSPTHPKPFPIFFFVGICPPAPRAGRAEAGAARGGGGGRGPPLRCAHRKRKRTAEGRGSYFYFSGIGARVVLGERASKKAGQRRWREARTRKTWPGARGRHGQHRPFLYVGPWPPAQARAEHTRQPETPKTGSGGAARRHGAGERHAGKTKSGPLFSFKNQTRQDRDRRIRIEEKKNRTTESQREERHKGKQKLKDRHKTPNKKTKKKKRKTTIQRTKEVNYP